jgi:hypothetical protein
MNYVNKVTRMPFDKFVDIETITKERSKAIEKSIRTISIEELKKLGEEIFHYPEDPWRLTLLRLIEEHPAGTFYHANDTRWRHLSLLPGRRHRSVGSAGKRDGATKGDGKGDDEECDPAQSLISRPCRWRDSPHGHHSPRKANISLKFRTSKA